MTIGSSSPARPVRHRRPQGFQIDLLAALAPLAGVEFEVVLQAWPQTEADFRAGRVDVAGMVDTTGRRTWAQFARGHATPAIGVYRRRDRPEQQSLPELAGLRVALLDGEAMHETRHTWPGCRRASCRWPMRHSELAHAA